MKKRVSLCIIIVVLCLMLQGCPNRFVASMHPTQQKGTTWISEDGRLCFTIDPGKYLTPSFGTLQTTEGIINIVVHIGISIPEVEFSKMDDYNPEEPVNGFATGFGKVNNKDSYTITIRSAEELFEVGEVFVFHKKTD